VRTGSVGAHGASTPTLPRGVRCGHDLDGTRRGILMALPPATPTLRWSGAEDLRDVPETFEAARRYQQAAPAWLDGSLPLLT
jgi:hypothetical protein